MRPDKRRVLPNAPGAPLEDLAENAKNLIRIKIEHLWAVWPWPNRMSGSSAASEIPSGWRMLSFSVILTAFSQTVSSTSEQDASIINSKNDQSIDAKHFFIALWLSGKKMLASIYSGGDAFGLNVLN
jgi:hypothetical protein